MTRKLIFLLVLALGLTGLAGCKDDSPKIAVIDAEKVYQNSELAKKGMAHVEGLSQQINERLGQMREEIGANPEDQALSARLQEELMNMQQNFDAQQNAAAEKLNKAFEEAVEEYRQKNNLEAIFPAQMVIGVRPGADISDAVTALLDAKTVDFGAAVSAPASTAPAPVEQNASPAQDAAPEAGAAAPASPEAGTAGSPAPASGAAN